VSADVQTTELESGLRVTTVALPHLHTAAIVLFVKVGSRFETPQDNGLSHFVEHMLFRGTDDHPTSLAMNVAIESLGGTLYAETGRDLALFHLALEPDLVDAGLACAGYPLLSAGHPEMFRWHGGKVASALKKFRTVIVNCSACVYALRALYPAEGISMSTEILAVSEFLGRYLGRLPEPARKKVIYYHDPCYLARYAGVQEAPRAVLERVAEVREFSWSGSDTECCGGGGLLPKTMPDAADAMARRRLDEVSRSGGGTVVTSCATCAFMLKRNAPSGVDVADLPGAVAAALE
jgi:Fe-S oxidoreductase